MARTTGLAAGSRREFLVRSGLAGAAFVLPIPVVSGQPAPQALKANLWLSVHADGRIEFTVTKLEMGQGVLTALTVLVAEELDVEPSAIQVRFPATDELGAARDRLLETSSSRSVASSWRPVRLAAASAREMLVAAAARSWGVPAAECRAESGGVTHLPSDRRLAYGALAGAAAQEEIPRSPRAKRPAEFRRIGRPTLRIEGPAIVRGRLSFGCDERREGMLYAVLARPPRRGGTLRAYEPAPALAVPGVRHVVRLGESVAVVAETTWDALQGRAALALGWDGGDGAGFTSAAFDRLLRQTLDAPSAAGYDPAQNDPRASVVLSTGAPAPWPDAGAGLTAEYATPFQAHVPMEPPNALAQIRNGRHEVWCGTQFPGEAVQEIASRFGVPRAAVVVHPLHMGGGFGRREVPDYPIEALSVARAIGGGPVQVFWTREDDLRHDYYHPATRHRLAARLEGGRLSSWRHRVAAPSIEKRWGSRPHQPGLIARVETAGAWNLPYAVPDLLVEYVDPPLPILPGFWRGIEIVSNVFAVESFIDELAHAAGSDPLEFRLSHLRESVVAPMAAARPFPLRRLRGAFELAGARAGWASPLPPGRGRGVAGLVFDGHTACACIAEVTVAEGSLRVERVVCAIDCGIVVNPLGLAGNAESAIAWGLSALFSEVTFEAGIAAQASHLDYPILRLGQMPAVEVHTVPSGEPPAGTGEIPVPLVAPAVCNAVFRATGRRLRRLPIRPEDLA